MADKKSSQDLQKEIKKKIVEVEEIYQKYLAKLNELKKEQNRIVKEYKSKLDKIKLDALRKRL